jgi:GDPmannose 4,6-dehydratase
VATGYTHTVREFAKKAFELAGLNYENYIYIDPQFVRPADVNFLLGDSTKAKKELGWTPTFSFDDLILDMVSYDMAAHV